jgi:hypothetical protein
VNSGLNETLMRSCNTTLTVLLPLFALYFLAEHRYIILPLPYSLVWQVELTLLFLLLARFWFWQKGGKTKNFTSNIKIKKSLFRGFF